MDKLVRSRIKPQKVRPIARLRHNYFYLLLTLIFGLITIYLFFNFPPNHKFYFSGIGIPIIPVFFLSIIGFIFSMLTFVFIQKTQGIVISFFAVLYLIIRMMGITNWVFGALILALFIIAEIYIIKKN